MLVVLLWPVIHMVELFSKPCGARLALFDDRLSVALAVVVRPARPLVGGRSGIFVVDTGPVARVDVERPTVLVD